MVTTPREPVKAVTRRLLERRVAALPVVDDEGFLVGIGSELDMLRLRVPADPALLFPQSQPEAPAQGLLRSVPGVSARTCGALPSAARAASA